MSEDISSQSGFDYPSGGGGICGFYPVAFEKLEGEVHVSDANTRADELRRVRAQRAALLAVAKAAEAYRDCEHPAAEEGCEHSGTLFTALARLTAVHPDWREWTP